MSHFEWKTVSVKFWKFCDSTHIYHQTFKQNSSIQNAHCLTYNHFLFNFNLFLQPQSCICNLECMYTRVYSWSLWYQIIQLSSQIDTFFSFSLLQKIFILKTFKTLSNGGLYDQLENVMLIKRQWHFLESRRKKVIFGIKSHSLPLFPGQKSELW